MTDLDVLRAAATLAIDHLQTVGSRHVGSQATAVELRTALGGALPDGPTAPVTVIETLADAARPGIVATPGPRYFGFVARRRGLAGASGDAHLDRELVDNGWR
jgi:hypothetical protein